MMTVTTEHGRPHPAVLAASGSATIAVAFGFARYGYGLFVPTFRERFGLSTAAVGVIGSAAYVAYLVGLLGSGRMTARCGPRRPVLVGSLSAAVGMAVIATSTRPAQLVVGVVLAASSAGWAWAPFADAVSAVVLPSVRNRVLAAIGTGTTFGLVVAGPVALLCDRTGSWRAAWVAFALIAAVTALSNARLLPSVESAGREPLPPLRRPVPPEVRRLLGQAFIYGTVAAVYYTYAVDLAVDAGLARTWSALLWTLVGIGGVSGVTTGDLVGRIGARPAFLGCLVLLAISIALLALAPAAPLLVGVAALGFGFAYMPMASLLTLWNQELHAEAPTAGFTRVLAAMAAGSIAGPVVLGPLAGVVGLRAVFLVLAGLALIAIRLRPSRSHW